MKKHLFFGVVVAAVGVVPAHYGVSYTLMIVLQAIGLKRPDQYLSEIIPLNQLQFMSIIFMLIFVMVFVFLRVIDKPEVSKN